MDLVQTFRSGERNAITIEFDPAETRPAITVLLSRLAGLVATLGPRNVGDVDPLLNDGASELVGLLDHLHRVRMSLQGQEERVLHLANLNGVSLRNLALALEVSPETVRSMLSRIRDASEFGITAAALDLEGKPRAGAKPRGSLYLVQRASLRDGAGEMLAAFEASHDANRYADAYNAEFELDKSDPTRAKVLTVPGSYPNEIDGFPEIQPATTWQPRN